MNNNELQRLTENLAIKYFGVPFKHKAYFNQRLRTTGGRYLLKSHNIEINPKQLKHFGEDAIVQIVKHELCHYFLHLAGKGYQHRDTDFKDLSAKVGAPRFAIRLKHMKVELITNINVSVVKLIIYVLKE